MHTVSGRRGDFIPFIKHTKLLLLLSLKSTNCNNILLIITVLYALDGVFAFFLPIRSSILLVRACNDAKLDDCVQSLNVILRHTHKTHTVYALEGILATVERELNYIIHVQANGCQQTHTDGLC